MPLDYQAQLGERLRSIRNQQGLTLHDVEERSGGEWKAVVVGSYERGDRAISVPKLARLADFYGVPVADLLPRSAKPNRPVKRDVDSLVLDLTRLPDPGQPVSGPVKALTRYARQVQLQRGDYNGRVLTLRTKDLETIAVVSGLDPGAFTDELRSLQLIQHS